MRVEAEDKPIHNIIADLTSTVDDYLRIAKMEVGTRWRTW